MRIADKDRGLAEDSHQRGSLKRPRVLLVDPDPYLSFLVRSGLPQVEVLEVGADEIAKSLEASVPDVAVIELSRPDSDKEIATLAGCKKVGVISKYDYKPGAAPPGIDRILIKPFSPSELYRSISELAGLKQQHERFTPELDARIRRWIGVARLVAVAIAAVLEVATTTLAQERSLVLAGAFIYSALRLRWFNHPKIGAWLDVLVALALPVSDSGLISNYLPFRAVVALEVGVGLGVRTGVFAAFLVAVVATRNGWPEVVSGEIPLTQLFSALVLLPVIAIAGAFGYQLRRGQTRDTSAVLLDTNRTLTALYDLARSMPQGFDLPRVVDATLGEIRHRTGSPSAFILLGEPGLITLAGSYGVSPVELSNLRIEAESLAGTLGAKAAAAERDPIARLVGSELGKLDWVTVPLSLERDVVGRIVAAVPTSSSPKIVLSDLSKLVGDAALAVDNARLFDRIREVSADEERLRVARELHDGVAQTLAHMRLELEFLQRHPDVSRDDVSKELDNLSKVAEKALQDVRETIKGMRVLASREGLVGSIRDYLSELRRRGGPEITFNADELMSVAPEAQGEIFRIVQEGVSNAMRHANARHVRVQMDAADDTVRVTVEDDGIGFDSSATRSGGYGLNVMKERASRLGADLQIVSSKQGGTKLTLLFPSR